MVQILEVTYTKVDTIEKSIVETQVATIEQQETSQIDLCAPTTQDQGASQVIVIVQGKPKETKQTTIMKKQIAIQALVTLLASDTPSTTTL